MGKELERRPERPAGSDPWRGRALDLGCGTGRVTEILARSAERVAGIDLSPAMIARARARFARSDDLRESPRRPWLVVADMRRVAFAGRFELIAAGGDPFAHLPDDADRDRALAAVVAQLAPAGRFILEALWFPPARRERALGPGGLSIEHPGEALTVRERWWCAADGRCRARYEYLRDGRRLDTAEFAARHWTIDELEERCRRAGLAVTARWGAADRTPWHPERSARLLVEARPRTTR